MSNETNTKSLYTMKLYIVTETDTSTNVLLRTWVCFSMEEARECLKKRYETACAYNRLCGGADPTDCLDMDFFHWRMQNDMEVRYNICESRTFEE